MNAARSISVDFVLVKRDIASAQLKLWYVTVFNQSPKLLMPSDVGNLNSVDLIVFPSFRHQTETFTIKPIIVAIKPKNVTIKLR
jgi:hypothetical protein